MKKWENFHIYQCPTSDDNKNRLKSATEPIFVLLNQEWPIVCNKSNRIPNLKNIHFELLPPVCPLWGGFAIVFFCKVIGCLYHIRMPPAVPGELFGPRLEKNLYIYKFTKKWKKIGPMYDTIFICFWGLEITWECYFGDQRSNLTIKVT